jgi:inner membrane protein involved in colicin E2 resistance
MMILVTANTISEWKDPRHSGSFGPTKRAVDEETANPGVNRWQHRKPFHRTRIM